jgi:hypothetical protein
MRRPSGAVAQSPLPGGFCVRGGNLPTSTAEPKVVRIPTAEELDELLEPFRGIAGPLAISWALKKIGTQDDMDDEERAHYVFPEVSYEEIGRLYCFLRNARSLMDEAAEYLNDLEHWLWHAEPLDSVASFRARLEQTERKGGD